MSYCLNPNCTQPKNPAQVQVCQACGSKLLLRDRYNVMRMIGQGGFGATFLANDLSLPGHPCCVIKQLRPSGMVPNMFEMAKELFEREATTLGRIGNHPQVPRLLDYFDDGQQFYLVQEFVSGHNLQQEVKKNGPFSEAGVQQFLSEIMPMIEYIHSQQVIHRDIKPANLIRRDQDKKLVLIDFGAVKNRVNLNEVANTSDQTALTQFAVGTPGFAPPEQMAMRPVYASDIYAVGVTCIYLLTAKSPKDLDYNPSTGEMVWQKYVNVSNHFGNVLKKMMEIAVRDRYQTAQDVLRALDLEPYIEGLQQGLVTPPPPSEPKSMGGTLFTPGISSMNSSPSSPTSATSKLAMAIKARKARQAMREQSGGMSGFSHGSANRNKTTGSNRTNIQGRQKKNSKLDADAVLLAYRRGRKDFAGKNLSFLNLQGANLSGSLFRETKLTKINLEGANLVRADFSKASLTQAKLQKANLGRAYFDCANLAGADLRGADLSHAHLSNAILRGTNLCGANLSNARISDDQLAQAKTNWSTTMPNGKRGFFR